MNNVKIHTDISVQDKYNAKTVYAPDPQIRENYEAFVQYVRELELRMRGYSKQEIEETEVIVHENILVNKRNNLGLTTLPSEETGQFEWTYPVYEYNSDDLNTLLNSEKWMEEKSV